MHCPILTDWWTTDEKRRQQLGYNNASDFYYCILEVVQSYDFWDVNSGPVHLRSSIETSLIFTILWMTRKATHLQ